MKLTKQKFEKPVNGVGTVKLGRNSWSIEVLHRNDKGKEDTTRFSFKLDDLPENLPEEFALKNGKAYFVSVRADGSAINQLRPAKGMFNMKCSGLAKDDDGNILVLERTGQYGKYWQFIAEMIVTSGENKGILYPLYLPLGDEGKNGPRYRFVPDDDGNFTVVGNPDKSKNVAQLFDFITCTGLADVEIPFPEGDPEDLDVQEVLEVIDKNVRKLKRTFQIIVENGYPTKLGDFNGDTEDEDEDAPEEVDETEEEETPKTRTAKAKATGKKAAEADEDDEEEVKPRKRPKFDED